MLNQKTQQLTKTLEQAQNHAAYQMFQTMENAHNDPNFLQNFRASFGTYCQITKEKAVVEEKISRFYVTKAYVFKSKAEQKIEQCAVVLFTGSIAIATYALSIYAIVKAPLMINGLVLAMCELPMFYVLSIQGYEYVHTQMIKIQQGQEGKALYCRNMDHDTLIRYVNKNTPCGDYDDIQNIR